MPVFNRIRIINIRYDNREINDELFDYYDGCNALMNLANGSGKTVMVQTLFQPIHPNMSVGKWKIIDYLTGDKRPTFVMIEWRLDQTKETTYFMTGICMSITRFKQDDNQPGKALKYFTFTHTYSKGNEYDIANIPVLPEKTGNSKYPTYDEVQQLLKKYAASHQEFHVFRKEKQKDYQTHLREHYIFPEEWELLETINQAENGGGMSNLFESCKTSDLLFDRWILKKISDTNRTQRSSLMQALTALTLPMIESDQKLREKEQAEDVAEQLRNFEEVFQSYTNLLDRKEQKERRLAGVLIYTEQCREQKTQEMIVAQRTQEECRAEEQRIQQEELSQQYYDFEDERNKVQNNEISLKEQLTVFEKRAEDAKRNYRLMQAAQYKSVLIHAEKELLTARNLLQTLSQGNEAERLQNLGYSLYVGYSHAVQEAKDIYAQIQVKLQSNKNEQKRLKSQKKELSQKQNELNIQKGVLGQKLQSFEESLSKYQEQIGCLPETDMTGDMIPESVEQIQTVILQAKEQADYQVKTCKQQIEKTSQYILDTRNRQEQLDEQIKEAQTVLTGCESHVKECQRQIDRITEILKHYEIDSRYLYEKEENLLRMKEYFSSIQAEYDKTKREKDLTEEKLEKLKNNCLHTSPKFAHLLEQNGIHVQTGESYLKQQDYAFQQKLLSINPLLPYCYLVSDTDYQKVLSIPQNMFVDKLCPVLRMQDIDAAMETSKHTANLGVIRFYSLFDSESMTPETSVHYVQKLEQRRDVLKEEIEVQSQCLQKVQRDMDAVNDFSVTRQDVDTLSQKLLNAEKHASELQKQKQILKKTVESLDAEREKLRDTLRLSEQAQRTAEQRQNAFVKFLNDAREAFGNRTEQANVCRELKKVTADFRICEDVLDETAIAYQELREQQAAMEQRRDNARNEAANYAQYSEGEVISGDLKQLEMEYIPLYQKQRQDRSDLDRRCQTAQKSIYDNQNQLKIRFSDLEESLIPEQFDGEKLDLLQEQERKANDELSQHRNAVTNAENELKRLEKELQKKNKELIQIGLQKPLLPHQIKGNYQKRKNDNHARKKEAVHLEQEARKILDTLTSRKIDLEKLVSLSAMGDSVPAPVTEEINFSAESTDFMGLKDAVRKQLGIIQSAYQNLQDRYREADNWILETVAFIRFEECDTYQSCYYLYEQLKQKESLLQEQIRLLETELSNIANNRSHIIRQVYEHAEFLVDQVRDLSSHSFVTLQGKRQKTLEIVLPDQFDSQTEQRIAQLADKITLKLRQQLTLDSELENKLFNEICVNYSDREIFNAYTNSHTISIRVLKVLQDERNSRLENWEKRYSGGERFITYFIAYSALADYTRRKSTQNQKSNIKSVFLIDNPFGEASSDHLVKSLIEITKKFNMQLICFSDLKQSSITNNFDLIYQLSMRKALYSSKSHLHIDEIINHVDASKNSMLEFVSLRSQLSIFDNE